MNYEDLMRDAHQFAKLHSSDPDTQVCTLYVDTDTRQILVSGCNVLPEGLNASPERLSRPLKYKYIEHAERNGIYNACAKQIILQGCTAITTLFPCVDCTRAMIQCGVKKIVTHAPNFLDPKWGDDFAISSTMLREANVEVHVLH